MNRAIPLFLALLFLALLLTAPTAASAQPQERPLPDTPAGDRAADLLEALRGDEALRRAFVRNALHPDLRAEHTEGDHLSRLERLASDLEGAERVGVRMAGPLEITLAYRTAGGETFRLSLRVEEDPPHRLRGTRVETGGAGRSDLEFSTWEELDARLSEMAAEGRFSGVVLAAAAGKIRFHRPYGQASLDPDLPVGLETRFNVGSLVKPFTGTLILRLAQEGRVNLDAPVGEYVEGLRPDVARRVTLMHLLRHRSGLGDYLRLPAFRRDPDRFRSVDDLLALVREQPLEFEPGTGRRYSNSGFVLLGAVVEAVTGRPYGEVLEDWILEPAGMDRTSLERPGSGRRGEMGRDVAVPYRRGEGEGLEPAGEIHADRGSPAGGAYSTARDLHAFARALLADRLLEPGWTDLLLAGYDREIARAEGRVPVGWGGGGPGVNATLEIEPDGTVVAVVANRDPPAASRVGISIARWLRERRAGRTRSIRGGSAALPPAPPRAVSPWAPPLPEASVRPRRRPPP